MKKSIFLFFAAFLCAMSVQAKNIYVDMSSAPSWYDNAYIHYWDGSNDKYVKLNATSISKMYVAEIADNYQGWRVCRYVSNTRYNDCTWVSDKTKNKFTVNSDGNGGSSATIIGLVTGGYILFDNSLTKWSDGYRYFVIGHDSYYKTIGGNNTSYLVKNTKLWCIDANTESWKDAKYFAFLSHDGSYPTASKPWSDIEQWGKQKTEQYTSTYSLDKNSIYLCVPTSGSGSPKFDINYKSNADALNSVITVKAKVSTNSGTSYADATSPGALSASSFKFTTWNTCNTATSLSSGEITCGYTANTTLTAVAATGYTFAGWHSGATKISDNLSITVNPTGDVTYYAYYKANQYTVKFDSNEGTGTMSDQSYTYDIEQALTANAFTRTGYTFEGWNTQADGTGTSYTDKQSVSNLSSTDGATITLYAQWAEIPANNHNITYTAQGTGWTYGTTPASAEEGTTVTFVVNPTTGYTVSVTSDDVTLNKNENEYTFTMPTKDVAINVSATENTHNVIVSYKCGDETIKADATVEAVGEVTTISVTAPEIDGYAFASWTLGSGIQSANTTANPISITTKASGDYTLTANYNKMVTVYLINNSNWANVYAYGWKNGEDQGTPAWPGAEITANKLAEKYEGYDVYSYKVKEGSYDNVIFNNGSGKQTATFDWENGKYYYAVDPLGSNVFLAGEMTNWGDGKIEFKKATAEATTASVTVTLAAQTYKFKLIVDGAWKGNTGTMKRGGESVHEGGWSFEEEGGEEKNCQIVADIAGDYTFTWNLTDKKLTVAYPPLPKHKVTATVNPAESGTVTGTDEYEQGSEATLTATPAAGYTFIGWSNGETANPYTFEVTKDVTLTANFKLKSYTITATATNGTVTGAGTYDHGTSVTLTATPAEGYTFKNWTVAGTGTEKSVEAKYTFTVTEPIDLVANFELKTYTVKFLNYDGEVLQSSTVNHGETPVYSGKTPERPADAQYTYTFNGWDNAIAAATGDQTYKAQFNTTVNQYTITVNTVNGTVTGADTYDYGTNVTLTATPDFDYVFVNWTVGGEVVSTDNPYTFPASANVEVVANFQEVAATTAKSGKFSTGKYEYAEFATGNLQYKKDGEHETWRFAKQQYQVVGEQNINVGDPNFKGWIDMFGWSTNDADNNFGVNPSMATDFYTGNFNDWGIKIGEGWLTLSHDQWDYLLNKRANASSLKQVAYVGTVFGIMLFPDKWTYPDGCKVEKTLNHDDADGTDYDFYSYNYTLDQWAKLEAAGAVFLPAAGRRFGGYGNTYNSNGENTGSTIQDQYSTNGLACYWTSSKHTDGKRVSSLFNLLSIGGDKYKYGILNLGWYGYGNIGQSVRLAKVTSTLIEIGGGDNSSVIEANKDKIVNVQVNRTFKANDGYYTLCLPFALDADKIGKAYELGTITEYEADGGININLTEVDNIEAGKPYLVLPSEDLTNPIFEDVTINNIDPTTQAPEVLVAGVKVTFTGIINGVGEETNGTTEYYVGDEGKLYNGKVDKLGLRAFFTITDEAGNPTQIRARVVAGENVETGVEDIITTDAPAKVIENGQLIIIRGGVKYNVQGQRL